MRCWSNIYWSLHISCCLFLWREETNIIGIVTWKGLVMHWMSKLRFSFLWRVDQWAGFPHPSAQSTRGKSMPQAPIVSSRAHSRNVYESIQKISTGKTTKILMRLQALIEPNFPGVELNLAGFAYLLPRTKNRIMGSGSLKSMAWASFELGIWPPPPSPLPLPDFSQKLRSHTCAIFLESPGYKDPYGSVLVCQTCKYTNTKTNTLGTQYTLVWAPFTFMGGILNWSTLTCRLGSIQLGLNTLWFKCL